MNRTEHLLSCLAEECAEVAQRVSKALRFGLDEIQPGQDLTNAERILVELGDMQAVVEMLFDVGAIEEIDLSDAVNCKKEKVARFMAYAEECGALEEESHQPGGERR